MPTLLGKSQANQNKSQSEDSVTKWVYFFGAGRAEGDGTWRDLLGGKGAGLAEMTKIGLPVPAGFTIFTEACDYFYKEGKKYRAEWTKQVAGQGRGCENVPRKNPVRPTLRRLVGFLSVSARSMRGMRETFLNLAIKEPPLQALPHSTKNERFSYDESRR